MSIRRSTSETVLKLLKQYTSLLSFLFVSVIFSVLLVPKVAAYYEVNATEDIQSPTVDTTFTPMHTELVGISQGKSFTPFTVRFVGKDIDISVLTYSTTVADLISTSNIPVDSNDKVIPSVDTEINSSMVIKIISVDSVYREEYVEVPYSTKTVVNEEMYINEQEITQRGINGEKLMVYESVYEDGVMQSESLIREIITKEKQVEIIQKGSKLNGPVSCEHWDDVIDLKTTDPEERYWMKFVMRCESACDPQIVSRSKAYHGLYQYNNSTFTSWGGQNIYDGEEQIEITLKIYRGGLQSKWPHCNDNALANMPSF